MAKLTVDLATSADVLGTTPDRFLVGLKCEHLHSLLYFNDMSQISIFTLARILDTTPRELVDFLEELRSRISFGFARCSTSAKSLTNIAQEFCLASWLILLQI